MEILCHNFQRKILGFTGISRGVGGFKPSVEGVWKFSRTINTVYNTNTGPIGY